MIQRILKWLRLPEASSYEDLDDPAVTQYHARLIKEKPFLNKIYRDFYETYQKALGHSTEGMYVELGSGGGFVKECIPYIKTSDVLCIPNIDLSLTAENIPFKDDSVDAFLMIDVFHHVKDPASVLSELNRCLKPGGKVIMIEPANTLWGWFIYKNFHHETFDPSADWAVSGEGPLSSANGAIPWIVFNRDRKRFETEFKSLRIKKICHHTPFRYLISGGVSMRQLMPSWMYPVINGIEFILSPINGLIGMFSTIELQKIS